MSLSRRNLLRQVTGRRALGALFSWATGDLDEPLGLCEPGPRTAEEAGLALRSPGGRGNANFTASRGNDSDEKEAAARPVAEPDRARGGGRPA